MTNATIDLKEQEDLAKEGKHNAENWNLAAEDATVKRFLQGNHEL